MQGESARAIDDHLDKVWPSLTPQGFLVDLLSSRRQLLGAGRARWPSRSWRCWRSPTGTRVGTWQWSVDDVPLLDAAEALLNGVAATYEHIVVDEAQDLSPLQLESIRRRSRTGSMTVLGDLAQATSPWAHQSWDAVVACLRHERVTATAVELEYGYRLPAEVHDVAMRLLPEAAPGLGSPRAVWASGHEVAVVPADGRPGGRGRGQRARAAGQRHRRRRHPALGAGRPRGGARRRGIAWSPSCARRRRRWWCSPPTTPRVSSSTSSWWWSRPPSSRSRSTGCGRCSWP